MAISFEEFKTLATIGQKYEYAKKADIKITGNRVLLIIDMQNDFMENGTLPVQGASKDAERLSNFLFGHTVYFREVVATMDTHGLNHIFFPGWWADAKGETVKPFTAVTRQDLLQRKYIPRFHKKETLRYVEGLEQYAKNILMVWPYHCIANTWGHSLEQNVFDALCFYEAAGGMVTRVYKGTDPLTEMYGVFKSEYPEDKNKNIALLKKISHYDTVYIAGEAKSHCVLSTVKQLTDYMQENGKPLHKIHLLSDCMSTIAGFEEQTAKAFEDFEKKGMKITDTKEGIF